MKDYTKKHNLIYYRDSDGYEYWRDYNGNGITKEQFDRLYNK